MHETTAAAAPNTYHSPDTPALSPAQKRAGLIALLLLALAALWTLHTFLPALCWGAVLAVSLWPWYQRRCAAWPGGQRLLLPAAVTFAVTLVFILPLVMVIGAVAHDGAALIQWTHQAREFGIPPPALLAHLPMGTAITTWWQDNLGHPGGLGQLSRAHAGALPIGEGGWVFGALARRLITIAFALLALFFLLRDGDRAAIALRAGSRRAFGAAGENVINQIVAAIRGTVNGLVVVGLGEGVIIGLAYALTRVPHAALFALLTALLSVVPLGSVLAFLGAAGLLFASGEVVGAIEVIVVGGVVVFIADHFVRPVMIGGATKLPFMLVLIGILGGIEGWGLIGVVLGPALMAALMLLWREWIGALPGPLNPPE